jgi:hypothetical protein
MSGVSRIIDSLGFGIVTPCSLSRDAGDFFALYCVSDVGGGGFIAEKAPWLARRGDLLQWAAQKSLSLVAVDQFH